MAHWANLADRLSPALLAAAASGCFQHFGRLAKVGAAIPDKAHPYVMPPFGNTQIVRRRLRRYQIPGAAPRKIMAAEVRPGDIVLSPELSRSLMDPGRHRLVVSAIFRDFAAAGTPFCFACSDGLVMKLLPDTRVETIRQDLSRLPVDKAFDDVLAAVLMRLWPLDAREAQLPTLAELLDEGDDTSPVLFSAAVAAAYVWNLVEIDMLSGRSAGREKHTYRMAQGMVDTAAVGISADDRGVRIKWPRFAASTARNFAYSFVMPPVDLTVGYGAEYLPDGLFKKTETPAPRWVITDLDRTVSLSDAGRNWLLADSRLKGIELLEDAMPTEPTPPANYTFNIRGDVRGSAFAMGENARQTVETHNDPRAREAIEDLIDLIRKNGGTLRLSDAERTELTEAAGVLSVSLERPAELSSLRLAGRTIYRLAGELFVGAAGNGVWEAFKAVAGF